MRWRRRSRRQRGGERSTRGVGRPLRVDRLEVHRQIGHLAARRVPLDLHDDLERLHVQGGAFFISC
eukprot:5385642-Prymnesium_polylepis.1